MHGRDELGRSGQTTLQRSHEHGRYIKTGLVGDFSEAGRTGDIDLAEPAIDHIDAHKKQAFGPQRRCQLGADGPFRPTQLRDLWRSAHRQVAAELTAARHPVHRAQGLPIHQQDLPTRIGNFLE